MGTLASLTQTSGFRVSGLGDRLLVNVLWFDLFWLTCVVGQSAWFPASVALLALHLLLISEKLVELRIWAVLGLFGIAVDSGLSVAGVFKFDHDVVIPVWLICLWLGFVSTLGRSLRPLIARPWLAMMTGAFFGPLSYWGGEKLGAVEFGFPLSTTLVLLGFLWAILLPLLLLLHEFLSRPIKSTMRTGGSP
ncbi:DUF2878 domain-containing protein [Corallincola luteus]|uniref:DUF2878 domain-containing protein n=1 Tax=Corallincola luteus TaxID=1775177 RepID=A0ABY2AN22_9GAMM|nr:DUF2878 domain-containing protein [Corallincola luteus]TCI04604.1 DUF2878 domain-containing protein [Corallincola luteus]